ncbi:hypothetical protein LTR94_023988 [Friedmanniomyces endolithicus]|nr:hypothetical protein LTR94_023988 [Friedmanniomyces endolithicus]
MTEHKLQYLGPIERALPAPASALAKKIPWGIVVFVGIPTLLAAIYFLLIASPRYVSEARFIVRSASGGGAPSSFGIALQGVGLSAGQTDAFAVHEYITSTDAVRDLSRRFNLEQVFGKPGVDFWSRYPRIGESRSAEGMQDALHRFVTVGYDSTTGISTLRVEAFTAREAQALSTVLLDGGESLVNRLNERATTDAVANARAAQAQARAKVDGLQNEITQFRTREAFIDPGRTATESSQMIGSLMGDLAQLRAERNQIAASAPSSPQLPALDGRIAAYQREIDAARNQIAGSQDSLAPKVGVYEDLNLRRGLAAEELTQATASLILAEQEAKRQQLYLERIIPPSRPEEPQLMEAASSRVGLRVDSLGITYRTRKNPIFEGLTFDLAESGRLAILGRNGQGKSTLIRLLGGIQPATEGRIDWLMKPSWPIGFGGGFQGSLSGLDNIKFLSRIYDRDYKDTLARVDAFAELGRSLRLPVKHYSSGMRARLAFGLSLAIEFDCYLIDEIIAVGDARFARKCHEELFEARAHRAFILASHNVPTLLEYCDRALLIEMATSRMSMTLEPKSGWMRRAILITPSAAYADWLTVISSALASAGYDLVVTHDHSHEPLSGDDSRVFLTTNKAFLSPALDSKVTVIATDPRSAAFQTGLLTGARGRDAVIDASKLLIEALEYSALNTITGGAESISGKRVQLFNEIECVAPLQERYSPGSPVLAASAEAFEPFEMGLPDQCSISWSHELFLYDPRREKERSRIQALEMTGGPRSLVHGPDMVLPKGEWSISAQFTVDDEAARYGLRFEWGQGESADCFDAIPRRAGRYQIDMQAVVDSGAPVELRVKLTEGSMGGQFEFIGAVLNWLDRPARSA